MSLFKKIGHSIANVHSRVAKEIGRQAKQAAPIAAAYMTGGASMAMMAVAKNYIPSGTAGEELVEAATTAASSGSFPDAIKDYASRRLLEQYGGSALPTTPLAALDTGDGEDVEEEEEDYDEGEDEEDDDY